MNRQKLRSGDQTLLVGYNEIFFKVKGKNHAFKNANYTFLIFDALGQILNFDDIKYYADRVRIEYKNTIDPSATLYVRYIAVPFT